MYILLFFFKNKTAYELRFSSWSSDVCSSDLGDGSAACVARDAAFPVGSSAAHPLVSAHGGQAQLVHCSPAAPECSARLQGAGRPSRAAAVRARDIPS